MNILLLRLLVLFYICGLVFLLLKLISSDMAKNKRRYLAILLFPVCLLTKEGRQYLKTILNEGENKK